MLMLLFQAGTRRYALNSQQVLEVIPWASLHPISQSHQAIAGLLNYHSKLVSVLDLGQLIDQTSTQPNFGARIIMVRVKNALIPGFETSEWLGLLADRVVDTLQVKPEMLVSVGQTTGQAPYLGKAIVQDQEVIRCFQPEGIDLSLSNQLA